MLQVDERMNKMQIPAEELPDRLGTTKCRSHLRTAVRNTGLVCIPAVHLRNIIISLGKINNYAVYLLSSLSLSLSGPSLFLLIR